MNGSNHSGLHKKIRSYVELLQRYTDRLWYPPLIALLAALDNIVIVIPNDGILISSAMLIPRRWAIFAVAVTIGSTLGAIALAALVELQGLPWILEHYPGLNESQAWKWSATFFDQYGLLLVFAVAILPIMQQPAVILASLANTPLLELTLVLLGGRFLKFIFMAYVASHAPRLLSKLWGLEGELKDAGVNLK